MLFRSLRDQELLARAKEDAFEFVTAEPPELNATVDYLRSLWQRRYRLAAVA